MFLLATRSTGEQEDFDSDLWSMTNIIVEPGHLAFPIPMERQKILTATFRYPVQGYGSIGFDVPGHRQ